MSSLSLQEDYLSPRKMSVSSLLCTRLWIHLSSQGSSRPIPPWYHLSRKWFLLLNLFRLRGSHRNCIENQSSHHLPLATVSNRISLGPSFGEILCVRCKNRRAGAKIGHLWLLCLELRIPCDDSQQSRKSSFELVSYIVLFENWLSEILTGRICCFLISVATLIAGWAAWSAEESCDKNQWVNSWLK